MVEMVYFLYTFLYVLKAIAALIRIVLL